jgi:hypothetical protein
VGVGHLVIHLAEPLEDQLKIKVGELSIGAPFHAGASHAGFQRGPGMKLLLEGMGHGITHGFDVGSTLEIAGPDPVSPNRGNSEAHCPIDVGAQGLVDLPMAAD